MSLSEMSGRTAWPWLVYAANDIGWAYPYHIEHWVTLHAGLMPTWKKLREAKRYPMDFKTWGGRWVTGSTDAGKEGIDEVFDVKVVGSSGMFGVELALHHGADRIVLAGAPIDCRPNFFSPKAWDSALTYQPRWRECVDVFDGRVRSLSGFTEAILGRPDKEWLGL